MATYRIYVLEENGHIRRPPVTFDCDTDDEAIEILNTHQQHRGHAKELWQGARLLMSTKPQ